MALWLKHVLEGLLAAIRAALHVWDALGGVGHAFVLADLESLPGVFKLTNYFALVRAHMFEVSHFLLGSVRDYLRYGSGKGSAQVCSTG